MARNIERERLRHGQNTEEIAEKIGVTKRTFERWEEDAASPQPANLLALTEAWADVEIDHLRPDLRREEETINRIEQKLDRLLAHAEDKMIEQIEAEFGRGEDRGRQTGG